MRTEAVAKHGFLLPERLSSRRGGSCGGVKWARARRRRCHSLLGTFRSRRKAQYKTIQYCRLYSPWAGWGAYRPLTVQYLPCAAVAHASVGQLLRSAMRCARMLIQPGTRATATTPCEPSPSLLSARNVLAGGSVCSYVFRGVSMTGRARASASVSAQASDNRSASGVKVK